MNLPRFLTFAASATLALVASTQAQMLVDTTGGSVLSITNHDDDFYFGRSLGFTASVFGVNGSTADISVNGRIIIAGANILPMGMDLYVYAGNSVTEKTGPGYYSITWRCGSYNYGHVYHEAQAVIFGATTVMQGIVFQPNDIVFSYGNVGASPWLAEVGLQKAATTVPVPGSASTILSDANSSLLPVFGSTHKVILFRPNGAGSYLSIQLDSPGACLADFNRDGALGTQDIFDFLNAWFAGCP